MPRAAQACSRRGGRADHRQFAARTWTVQCLRRRRGITTSGFGQMPRAPASPSCLSNPSQNWCSNAADLRRTDRVSQLRTWNSGTWNSGTWNFGTWGTCSASLARNRAGSDCRACTMVHRVPAQTRGQSPGSDAIHPSTSKKLCCEDHGGRIKSDQVRPCPTQHGMRPHAADGLTPPGVRDCAAGHNRRAFPWE
jgi:hypothetical protein